MREVAVVSFTQRQEARIADESEVEFMVPLMQAAKQAVGLTQRDIGFTCSGSSDFLAGQAFSFVHDPGREREPVPPISESHVEMDGAWALYEAWVKLQIGVVDTALRVQLRQVVARARCATCCPPSSTPTTWGRCGQTPLRSSRPGQARIMLESGVGRRRLRLAEIAVAQSLNGAADNPHGMSRSSAEVDYRAACWPRKWSSPIRCGPADLRGLG